MKLEDRIQFGRYLGVHISGSLTRNEARELHLNEEHYRMQLAISRTGSFVKWSWSSVSHWQICDPF